MTKPLKRGLDYFPLDTDIIRDLKIQRLLLEFGNPGFAVFIAVLCEVYASEGYYVAVKSGFYTDIAFALGLTEEDVKDIVCFCAGLELFDQILYEEKMILTSYGVQQRYNVISKRTKNRIREELRIVREEDFPESQHASYINENKNKEVYINKNENGNINTNTNKTEINYGKEKSNNRNDESARRAELLRMAAIATRGGSDA